MQNYKKKYGQHFLHDRNIIQKIIYTLKPKTYDDFIEIGPGEGALTNSLIDQVDKITLIEKDKDLIPFLKNQYSAFESILIVQADILKYNLVEHVGKKTRIIGNLPYNISTEIIFKMISVSSKVKDLHFMLQKEVVDRIVASPGSRIYGRLSIMTQVYFEVEKLFDISPNVFIPKPKVQSSYIKMTPKNYRFEDSDHENKFKKLVLITFTARRKMIKTSLKDYIDDNMLESLLINPNSRPENLTIEEFLKIAKYI